MLLVLFDFSPVSAVALMVSLIYIASLVCTRYECSLTYLIINVLLHWPLCSTGCLGYLLFWWTLGCSIMPKFCYLSSCHLLNFILHIPGCNNVSVVGRKVRVLLECSIWNRMYSLDSVPVFRQFNITIIMCSRLFRPLNSHNLVVRHTISAFILQLLVNLTI